MTVVREGALFSGQASIDLEDAPRRGRRICVSGRRAADGLWGRGTPGRRVVQVESLWADGRAGSQRRAGARRPTSRCRKRLRRSGRPKPPIRWGWPWAHRRIARRGETPTSLDTPPDARPSNRVSLAWVGLRCSRDGRRYSSW